MKVASSLNLNPTEICKCGHAPGVFEFPSVNFPIEPRPSEEDIETSKVFMESIQGVFFKTIFSQLQEKITIKKSESNF
jgi:hypothetical protein